MVDLQPLPWHQALPWILGHQPLPEKHVKIRKCEENKLEISCLSAVIIFCVVLKHNTNSCCLGQKVCKGPGWLRGELYSQCYPWVQGHQQHPEVLGVHVVQENQELLQLQQHPTGGSTYNNNMAVKENSALTGFLLTSQ